MIIRPGGLEYHDVGYSVITGWGNLDRLALVPGSYNALNPEALAQWRKIQEEIAHHRLVGPLVRNSLVEAILLRRAVAKTRSWWTFGMVPQNRIIPLSDFKQWRYSELRRVLERDAPQLFPENEFRPA
jgi:hypothetical protein